MGITASDLRDLVIIPVLTRMAVTAGEPKMDSPAAVNLLLGTAAHESLLGKYLTQHPTGPARGIYQMEVASFNDLNSWLLDGVGATRAKLRRAALEWSSPAITLGAQVAGNMYFATAMARVFYWRKSFTLRGDETIEELAAIWKKYWNTDKGKGTPQQWIDHYKELVHV